MNIHFNKSNGLVPAIIQDNRSLKILMLGYMNEDAYRRTKQEGKVTFFSRNKNRLWTKGETSGNFLWVNDIAIDCDNDTLLIKATPDGPTCHTGAESCFPDKTGRGFLHRLEAIIEDRITRGEVHSYSYQLYQKGINKIAQKVGEEAVELVIEAKDQDQKLFKNEAADLLFHFLILLKAKEVTLEDIETVLLERNSEKR